MGNALSSLGIRSVRISARERHRTAHHLADQERRIVFCRQPGERVVEFSDILHYLLRNIGYPDRCGHRDHPLDRSGHRFSHPGHHRINQSKRGRRIPLSFDAQADHLKFYQAERLF